MSTHVKIEATVRENAGRGTARAARREKLVPAVIYGNKQEPLMINIDLPQVIKALKGGKIFTHLCDISVGGKTQLTLARDIQFHPINDIPMHVDFMRVTEKTLIEVEVPVHFINEDKAPGLKTGGVLNVVSHKINIKCPANNIPEHIEIDLDGLEQGDAVHISSVKLPQGTKLVDTAHDSTVLTIVAPKAVIEEETEAAPAAEAAAAPDADAAKKDE